MSMLAERRRKTKWVINPTKKPLWTTESNGIKFGKELMEKMGWSAGKGLGAKEQGIQEPLKVSYKNDTKGMGFKGNDDDWIEQQDEFNVLLNQLRNSDDSSVVKVSEEEKNEIKSLEEKSKQSRARVHYQKFTRGKDLSRYSENDLACILGTNKIKKEKSKTEEVVESEDKGDGGLVTSFGVTTINSGSIQDYFKRKWITDKVCSKSVEKEKEEHSCDERPSFSRVFEESKEFSIKEDKKEDGALDGSEINGNSGEKCEKRKKRKKKDVQTSKEEEPKSKRKKTSEQDSPVDEEMQNLGVASNEIETENLLECENNCDSLRKRKKEKRKSKKDGHDESEETYNLEVKKKKKKEKKGKPVENGYSDTEVLASIDCSLEAECPEEELKKKKVKKESEIIGEINKENIEEHGLDVSVGGMNAVVGGQIGKQKKKCKDHGGSVGVENCSEKNELGKVSDVCEGEVGSKKKKKKKEKQDDKMEWCSNEKGISCEIQVEKCDNGSNSNRTKELEVKKKKKKKEEPEGEKVECLGNEGGPARYKKSDGDNNSTVELKGVNKKKKEKEKQEGGREECNGNGNEIQVEKCDNGSNLNSNAELELKKRKKKKEKQEDGMECCSNESELLSEVLVGKCDGNNLNSNTELEDIKKKRKKKKQEGDKVECGGNGNGISNEIQVEKCDNGSNLNTIVDLKEVKKKKKKKEKKEDKMECYNNESGLLSEIPEGNCDNGNISNSIEEVEVKKKKKKDKNKTKEEDSNSNDIKESSLDEAHQEGITGLCETVEKKKKKDKKEKQKSKDESLNKEQESKESFPDQQSTNDEVGSNLKSNKNKCESEVSKEEEKEEEEKEKEEEGEEMKVKRTEGNAEIGTTAGIDKVELISQRAAYEHVAGQHRYERVKKMIEFVNLNRFKGSNLECLGGYGNTLRKGKPSDR